MKRHLTLYLLFITAGLFAQNIDSKYQQADAYRDTYSKKFYNGISAIQPVHKTHTFWYLTHTPAGNEFRLMDVTAKKITPAFDQTRLAASLSKILPKEVDPYQLPFRQIRFNESRDSLFFSIRDTRYQASLKNYNVEEIKEARRPERFWGSIYKEDSKDKVKSPDGTKEAYILEGNLWVTDLATGESKKLSIDGSPFEYYSSNIYWSPDSRKLVSSKYRPVDSRKLFMVASSPRDQLQPKVEEYDYPKPGDALPIRRPYLFLVEEGTSMELAFPEPEKQFDLRAVRWDKKSEYVTFQINKRGHQQYTIYAGDLKGNVREVVNEVSDTFIFYDRLSANWMEDSNELLWISERDGWRHLYLYDITTGRVKKQLTSGEWVFKSVIHVDEKNRKVIFTACGKDPGEDPYLTKYYTLNIDNGQIVCLTPENANHQATFTADYKYMVDNYSRVDLAPVVVVRNTEDGKVVYQPKEQPDITEMQAAGWRMPEVFSAKGRDGVTDIWGVIIRPTDFDPSKKYPVVEYIYAGPHDSHVPKSFAVSHRCNELAEIGFITVLIDGMGTANRSKAFHDVCWKNLKDAGFPDRIAWMKAAAANYPEMDIERVGIYGGSAGGQNSMSALLFHPEFYKVGVAACGCHDNRMDKIWWNEQWMGYPVGKEYEECSNVVNAHLLEGKLMLILGELDNNVDPSSTLQVVDELIRHNKEFEFVMLPGERHTLGGDYGERKRRDFFVRHLINTTTPEWNK